MLRQLDFHAHGLALVDRELAQQALADPVVARLMTIPGVDAIAAISIVAAVGDFSRFSDPNMLVAYVGLNPKLRQSGNSKRQVSPFGVASDVAVAKVLGRQHVGVAARWVGADGSPVGR